MLSCFHKDFYPDRVSRPELHHSLSRHLSADSTSRIIIPSKRKVIRKLSRINEEFIGIQWDNKRIQYVEDSQLAYYSLNTYSYSAETELRQYNS
jgi:hypothetical protein